MVEKAGTMQVLAILADHWVVTYFRQRLANAYERIAKWKQKHSGALKKFGYPAVLVGMGFYALFFLVAGLLLITLLVIALDHKTGNAAGAMTSSGSRNDGRRKRSQPRR